MTDENIVPEGETPAEDFESTAGAAPQDGETAEPAPSEATTADGPVTDDQLPPDPFLEDETDWQALAAERTVDLQRLQAEYVNYKRRVDRDRALARQSGVEAVVSDLLPVMDGIELARSHDDLAGGFKLVADELAKVTGKHGLVAFGAVGEPFDPTRHEALMQVPMEGPVEVTTISQVMQQGYALGDRVIRPARVGVANPQ